MNVYPMTKLLIQRHFISDSSQLRHPRFLVALFILGPDIPLSYAILLVYMLARSWGNSPKIDI